MAAATAVAVTRQALAKPLVSAQDMAADTAAEVVEIVTAAIDKYLAGENYERAAQTIKEALDKRFGPTWHCGIGEGYGYECSATQHLSMFYGEKCSIVVWQC